MLSRGRDRDGSQRRQIFECNGPVIQLRRHGGQRGDKPAGSLLQPEFLLPKSLNPRLGRRVFYRKPTMFRPTGRDDTKLRRDETVFRTGEDIRKLALDTNRLSNEGPQRPMTGD